MVGDGAWGWFGKLPALGDFASRRLPQGFIEPWDDWLAQGLAAWRASDESWLQAYLAGPIWCFHLGNRVLAGRHSGIAWAGVLMPSVDRVGRYFPLTVAAPAASEGSAARLLHRLAATAHVAADALHEDWTADQLDAALVALQDLTVPPWGDEPGAPGAALTQWQREPDAAQTSLWWPADGPLPAEPRRHRGLPHGAQFASLLGAAPAPQ